MCIDSECQLLAAAYSPLCARRAAGAQGCAAHARNHVALHGAAQRSRGTSFAVLAGMFQRSAYYLSPSKGALRLDLTELEPDGPYRLILDDAASRHIEYFADS